jgi:hypothetical protein
LRNSEPSATQEPLGAFEATPITRRKTPLLASTVLTVASLDHCILGRRSQRSIFVVVAGRFNLLTAGAPGPPVWRRESTGSITMLSPSTSQTPAPKRQPLRGSQSQFHRRGNNRPIRTLLQAAVDEPYRKPNASCWADQLRRGTEPISHHRGQDPDAQVQPPTRPFASSVAGQVRIDH